ncbi:MAG: F0F1 ATP synthase subunit A [candidate division Zixibacteria bacterium]|nr:F0F1 ATP synthase subunit A [candidate division Zixibacteria bacterium]
MNLLLVEEVAKHATEKAPEGAPELPNFITFLYHQFGEVALVAFLHHWENVIFSWLVVIILCIVAYLAYRKRSIMPGKLQNAVEMVVEALDNFVCGILGPQGRKYTPFLGTLFVYILCMNFFGLVPGMKSPTANLNTTLALAICVFFYVQYTGVRNLGPLGYLRHMAGDPRDVVTWFLVPINIPIHIIEELAKPMSLSLRLFGNITGEDVLITVFVGLGVSALSFLHLPVGIPFEIPFLFLALLTGTIQALVFTLLSTIYFSLMLPHEED